MHICTAKSKGENDAHLVSVPDFVPCVTPVWRCLPHESHASLIRDGIDNIVIGRRSISKVYVTTTGRGYADLLTFVRTCNTSHQQADERFQQHGFHCLCKQRMQIHLLSLCSYNLAQCDRLLLYCLIYIHRGNFFLDNGGDFQYHLCVRLWKLLGSALKFWNSTKLMN